MKEQFEQVRKIMELAEKYVPALRTKATDALAALKQIEEEHERVKFIGTITPCPNCDGSGYDKRGSACCRIPGHARGCECAVCQWKRASHRNELEANALRAQVEQLRGTLRELRCETLDMEPDAWGIKCIEDHNAIIDEALATPNQKEPTR